MSDVPLPEPAYYQWRRKNMPWSLEFAFSHMCHATTEDSEIRTLHPADQMHTYAAAVSAAENARLREQLALAESVRAAQVAGLVEGAEKLRERVKVLEDALRVAFKWGGGLTVAEGEQIRAALKGEA